MTLEQEFASQQIIRLSASGDGESRALLELASRPTLSFPCAIQTNNPSTRKPFETSSAPEHTSILHKMESCIAYWGTQNSIDTAYSSKISMPNY